MISGIGDREKVQVRSLSMGHHLHKLSSSKTPRESAVGDVIIPFARRLLLYLSVEAEWIGL
jgi:hypothetical protein